MSYFLSSFLHAACRLLALVLLMPDGAARRAMELFVEARAAGKANAVLYGSIMQAHWTACLLSRRALFTPGLALAGMRAGRLARSRMEPVRRGNGCRSPFAYT